jgi:hypothetical protein
MPEFTVAVEVLHIRFHNIGCLHVLTGLKCTFNHPTGFQVTKLYPVEGLALAGFHEFVFDNGAGISVQHYFQPALELIGTVIRHSTLFLVCYCKMQLVIIMKDYFDIKRNQAIKDANGQ